MQNLDLLNLYIIYNLNYFCLCFFLYFFKVYVTWEKMWKKKTEICTWVEAWHCSVHVQMENESTQCCIIYNVKCDSTRYFQNRRLGSRCEALGAQKESTCYELWQAEPLHTSILQEGHHPQAWCVSETGLPVCSPSMRQQHSGRRRRWKPMELKGHTVLPPCTWKSKPEMKRWHGTCALTNPDGTHFTANAGATAGSFCMKAYLCMGLEEEAKQCGHWGFSLLQNNHRLKNRKKKISKWTALSFAWSACSAFINVIPYTLCQTLPSL